MGANRFPFKGALAQPESHPEINIFIKAADDIVVYNPDPILGYPSDALLNVILALLCCDKLFPKSSGVFLDEPDFRGPINGVI